MQAKNDAASKIKKAKDEFDAAKASQKISEQGVKQTKAILGNAAKDKECLEKKKSEQVKDKSIKDGEATKKI